MQDYHLHVAYVPKYEVQLATLTVTESLRTSLRLRLDRSVPDFVVELYTKKILHDMGLDNCADNHRRSKYPWRLRGRKATLHDRKRIRWCGLTYDNGPTNKWIRQRNGIQFLRANDQCLQS